MPFSSLPNEILELVVASCKHDRPALDRISRVNRALRELCQKELFKSLAFVDDGVVRMSDATDSAAQWTSELKYKNPRVQGLPLSKALPGILTTSTHLLSYIENLALHLRWRQPAGLASFVPEMVQKCVSLKNLMLHWSSDISTVDKAIPWAQLLAGRDLQTVAVYPGLPSLLHPFQLWNGRLKHLILSVSSSSGIFILGQSSIPSAEPLRANRITLKLPQRRCSPENIEILKRLSPPRVLELECATAQTDTCHIIGNWAGPSVRVLTVGANLEEFAGHLASSRTAT